MEKLIFRDSYPLWFFFLLGYVVIWAYMILVNYQRGNPIEHRELYDFHNRKIMKVAGILPTMMLFVLSIFMEVQSKNLTWFGLFFFTVGIMINVAALHSYTKLSDGLNDSGIYRLSRNPMYVGAFFFFAGLNLMAWASSLMSYLFLFFMLVWMAATHWMVLKEEQFLRHKYGSDFNDFKKQVRRYIA